MPAKIPSLVSSAALALVLLSGCAPEPATPVEPVSTASATATEEPDVPIVAASGDTLTAAEAKKLNGQIGTLRPYEKNDGSFIAIDVKQPLPEAVKQEVVERLGSVGNETGSALGALDRETSTGKTIIMVRQIHYSTPTGGSLFGWHAASYANGFPGFRGGSAETVAAQAQDWANSQPDPAQLEVVIVPN
jgi:hypothetical protein